MTRRGRAVAALAAALVAALTVWPAAPAGAAPLLEEADAVELANTLAEALEEQEICYGWLVRVQDDGGSLSGVDQGSSLGPGRDPTEAACAPSVVFVADIHYTSEYSESSDSARYRVYSTLPGFAGEGLDLGIDEGALLGDGDDAAIVNATSLLPALVAEEGLAPPLIAEETSGTIPAADGPTGTPSTSDRLRTHWPAYTLAGLIALAGVGWLVFALFLRSVERDGPHPTLSPRLRDDDDEAERPRWTS